jgi:hypothetical protein
VLSRSFGILRHNIQLMAQQRDLGFQLRSGPKGRSQCVDEQT